MEGTEPNASALHENAFRRGERGHITHGRGAAWEAVNMEFVYILFFKGEQDRYVGGWP